MVNAGRYIIPNVCRSIILDIHTKKTLLCSSCKGGCVCVYLCVCACYKALLSLCSQRPLPKMAEVVLDCNSKIVFSSLPLLVKWNPFTDGGNAMWPPHPPHACSFPYLIPITMCITTCTMSPFSLPLPLEWGGTDLCDSSVVTPSVRCACD